ncbi:MAG: tRNA (N6-isopentenyl adenosine(37)-C2)-methylthiotransferase MiaB [Bacteroidales bacterium]|jgi:tRNA-2-methylthio-N6-dimethylallyladenosine synthase|nr:tRNA (N6-isopentenyl adenosine(37)-C2)-methylthiotransferase MiaB [Bacteroidales bacterium]
MRRKKKLYIETYGCQMNFSDSEIVASIMRARGYDVAEKADHADVIMVNTCSIRDNAEQRVWKRLRELKSLKKRNISLQIGIIGCMAERLKEEILEEHLEVDFIAGPDSYRVLPDLIEAAVSGQQAANVVLSEEETYEDIHPVRLHSNGVSAFISIMRGCENFCAYCVVPFTRGKERSRNPQTIIDEARTLFENGYREITLLGQNVNSYRWIDDNKDEINFPKLLKMVAQIDPVSRIRFTTSHPKDLSDELLRVIAENENVCNAIHLAVQSGSTPVLERMNRKYTREYYLNRIAAIRSIIPDCAISTDIIAGFCDETEEDHQNTLSLMREARFDYAFMFKYSERSGTIAAKKFEDNISDDVKGRRLEEIIELQQEISLQSNQNDMGKIVEVLIEGQSKKSTSQFMGRDDRNKVVVFDGIDLKKGDCVRVKITKCTSATLIGEIVS